MSINLACINTGDITLFSVLSHHQVSFILVRLERLKTSHIFILFIDMIASIQCKL